MNLRPQKPDAPDINLTPLIDVVFLLLIFFMVSTTFKEDARLRLELPRADGDAISAEEITLVEIAIDAGGAFYVDGQQVLGKRIDTLKQALVGAVGPRRDLPVLIKADAQTPHQAVMTAMDAAGQLGLTRIAFAASRPDSDR
ncbi:MAG: biopolymer transporter ExbD [Thiohalocapsa sp.]|nr:biopolymer transporter ExbD [Thiohalocapsa sp.]